VHVGVLYDSREAARAASLGDVTLTHCHRCGLIHNRRFDTKITNFAPGYEVALHHSKVFREFTEGVARRLIHQYRLENKSIFEIGCGAGFFLRTLCQLGNNHGIGVDPTISREHTEQLGDGSVRFVRDFYGDRFIELNCDFICCLSVFEAIPDPTEFLLRVRKTIGPRHDVPVYFEVFNGMRSFEQLETWSVHYEQCNYFGLESLTDLFRRCGFEVLRAGTCYEGDQYLYVEARVSENAEPDSKPSESSSQLPTKIAEFSQHYREALDGWSKRLEQFRSSGSRVVLWGSGGKGISFLNALDSEGLIEYVVEINPDKHGKHIPGSGQMIVGPEFLKEYQPDKIIITNPLYEDEMKQQAAQLGVHSDFLIA
jgi:SAM-dependent methyltransferase